jgi:hypothetical protein
MSLHLKSFEDGKIKAAGIFSKTDIHAYLDFFLFIKEEAKAKTVRRFQLS